MVFSLRQYENWMWGWQLQIFLNILAVVTGIALLTHRTPTWGKLLAAVLCGIVATYSFANGLLLWPVGAFVLWSSPRDKAYKTRLAVWCICALLTAATYFYHYAKPSGSTPLQYALTHSGVMVVYFLTYMGEFITIKNTLWLTVPMGILELTLFMLSWRRLRQATQIPPSSLTPYLAYALYVIISALVCTVGRVGYGPRQAMESRYLTISELFWLATLVLTYLAVRQHD
jgi:hypothetical protein